MPGEEPAPSQATAGSRKGLSHLLRQVLDHGGPGFLQFAITNICNARCEFCNFATGRVDPAQWRSITLAEAKEVVDIAARNQIGYLLFVGGEPLAHRDLPLMIRYTAERGITPMVCTNGSLWTQRNMREFAEQGLKSVIMSIDSHEASRHEANRGLPEVCRKIREANRIFQELGVETTASVTASRLIDDYEKLADFLVSLGFNRCTFSYPLTSLGSSYLSFSDSPLVTYQAEELAKVFNHIKALKKRRGLQIINPTASLNDMQRHLRKQPEQFGCLGGHKYFYLDWNLNLYRCHAWPAPMCHIYDFNRTKLIRDGCTKCMIDCYRDPSVLQYAAVNLSDAYQDIKKGRLLSAARRLLDSRNVVSMKAVWEERKWIGRV